MADPKAHGRFVWYDLMTTDPQGAIAFYGNVLGWGTQKFNGAAADVNYTLWTNGPVPIGGVSPLPPEAAQAGAPPHWMAYVEVPDVDTTARRAEELGGQVLHPPTDVPGVGRFVVLSDPQGAVIAAFTSNEEAPGHDGRPNAGEFSWHELATTDYEGAFRFYSDLFGWEKDAAMDMGPDGMYQIYKRKEIPLGGMFRKPEQIPGPPFWLYYTKIDDMDGALEKVKKLGGQVMNGPMEVPGGDIIAQCMDPQGAMFALHMVKA